jgi:ubiquitin
MRSCRTKQRCFDEISVLEWVQGALLLHDEQEEDEEKLVEEKKKAEKSGRKRNKKSGKRKRKQELLRCIANKRAALNDVRAVPFHISSIS